MRVIGIRTTVPICLSIYSSSHPFHSVRSGNILPFHTCRRHIHDLSRTQSLFVRPITLFRTTILQNRPDNPPPPPPSPWYHTAEEREKDLNSHSETAEHSKDEGKDTNMVSTGWEKKKRGKGKKTKRQEKQPSSIIRNRRRLSKADSAFEGHWYHIVDIISEKMVILIITAIIPEDENQNLGGLEWNFNIWAFLFIYYYTLRRFELYLMISSWPQRWQPRGRQHSRNSFPSFPDVGKASKHKEGPPPTTTTKKPCLSCFSP